MSISVAREYLDLLIYGVEIDEEIKKEALKVVRNYLGLLEDYVCEVADHNQNVEFWEGFGFTTEEAKSFVE